jgi:hypothetical protein
MKICVYVILAQEYDVVDHDFPYRIAALGGLHHVWTPSAALLPRRALVA